MNARVSPIAYPLIGLPPLPPELARLIGTRPTSEEHPDAIVRQAFRVGTLRLLTPFADASELVEMPDVYPLPRAPRNLLGLINLHGRILPLFDLARLLETEHSPREKRMVLVFGHNDDAAAIVIDGLPRRMVFLPDAVIVPPALPAAAASAVRTAYSSGRDTWFEFDYAHLLDQLVS
jgi:twitching motility protein PilI